MGNHWYPATDQLRGTDVYGQKGSHSWSINFNSAVPGYNEFLFATGDCKKWLVAKKSSVMGWYSNSHRTIQASSTNSRPYSARWYRRSGNKEDPWISLNDHGPAIGQGNIVYGENRFGSTHARAVLPKHKGADVYIRKKGPKPAAPCKSLHGGGWVQVRHIGAGNHWYPATDQLRGTDVYGQKGSHSWSINFNSAVPGYNEFLFATGDCKKWLVAK